MIAAFCACIFPSTISPGTDLILILLISTVRFCFFYLPIVTDVAVGIKILTPLHSLERQRRGQEFHRPPRERASTAFRSGGGTGVNVLVLRFT